MPKPAAIMDEAEPDVLANMTFSKEDRPKLHSTNPIERRNGDIKRRTDVVGIFPNDAAIVRLVGALLQKKNDEWAAQRARYMTLETMAPVSDDPLISLRRGPLTEQARARNGGDLHGQLHHAVGHDRGKLPERPVPVVFRRGSTALAGTCLWRRNLTGLMLQTRPPAA